MSDGFRQLHFAVIGNPCKNPSAIPSSAPDVNCQSEQLVKATLSDNGHIIIGMFFEPGIPEHSDAAVSSRDQAESTDSCQARADAGHNSGMGMIFRLVAGISPVEVGATGLGLSSQTESVQEGQASESTGTQTTQVQSMTPAQEGQNDVSTSVSPAQSTTFLAGQAQSTAATPQGQDSEALTSAAPIQSSAGSPASGSITKTCLAMLMYLFFVYDIFEYVRT